MILFRDELVSLEQNFADVESERAKLEDEKIEYQVIVFFLTKVEIKILPFRATLDNLLVHLLDSDLLECT